MRIVKRSKEILNRAWFRYLFEDNDTDAFLNVLAKYQHESGGFGGIYYEFDYQGPCLKSTETAVKYILNLKEKPSANHPLIQNMMKYILGLYIPEIGNWGEVVVPEVNEGVHCYWVRYRGEDTKPIDNEGEPYDIEYFQWFVPCLKDKETADKLTSILCQNPTAFMELDFAKSDTEYVHLPCDVVGHPKSIVYPAVRNLVHDSLKYRMAQQNDDGRWPLGWSFGDDVGLKRLQTKYETYRTLSMLEKLDRFDMIEK